VIFRQRPSLRAIFPPAGKPVPVLKTPNWMTTGCFVASNDPNYPSKSVMFTRRGTHQYGKANMLTGVLKWRYDVGAYDIRGGGSVADIDGDGINELIFTDTGGILWALNPDGTLKTAFSIPVYYLPENCWTLADVDGDGKLEILYGAGSTRFYCNEENLLLKWYYDTAGDCGYMGGPIVFDVDGDGNLEIISWCEGGYVYCFNIDGTLKWSYYMGTVTAVRMGGVAYDVDGDGNIEILISNATGLGLGYCICLNPDGTLKWESSLGECRGLAVCDIDGDGSIEILIPLPNPYYLKCLKPDGTLKWEFLAGASLYNYHVGCYDVDGDGSIEIFIGNTAGRVFCLNPNGTEKWNYLAGEDVRQSPILADFDDDGSYEVGFGSFDLYFYLLETDGTLKWRYGVGDSIKAQSASSDDIDGDGKLEIFFGCFDTYEYCLTSD